MVEGGILLLQLQLLLWDVEELGVRDSPVPLLPIDGVVLQLTRVLTTHIHLITWALGA